MFQGQCATLIIEAVAWTTCAGTAWVAALGHKPADHAVKCCPIVKSIAGQEDKVIHRFRSLCCEQFNPNVAPLGMHYGCILLRGVNLHRGWLCILFCQDNLLLCYG